SGSGNAVLGALIGMILVPGLWALTVWVAIPRWRQKCRDPATSEVSRTLWRVSLPLALGVLGGVVVLILRSPPLWLHELLGYGKNLRRAHLSHANLAHADLLYADLRGADLRGASLRGAVLRNGDLRGANL